MSICAASNIKAIPELTALIVTRLKTKTEVATFKLTPACRRAWEAAALRETRSLANMFEVAILDYCKQHHIPAEQKDETPSKETVSPAIREKQ